MTALLTDNLPLLAGAPNGIKKLRELILDLAVRGKLVPQDPSDEPASELLKRIAEEKGRLAAEGRVRKQKSLAAIEPSDQPFCLPSFWEFVRLGELIDPRRTITYGVLKPGAEDPNGVPLVKTENVQFNRILTDFKSRISLELDEEFKRTRLRGGEVLLTLVGSIGRCAIAPNDLAGANLSRSVGMVVPVEFVNKDFMVYAITALINKDFIDENCAGTAQKVLNVGAVNDLVFPLPPLPEQQRIVAKVDELMALCDRLEARQADAESAHARLVQALLDSLTQASDADDFAASWQRLAEHFHSLFTSESSIDALKQTLLQLAVRGKLVQQDPSDEPASELLKRIAEEKARLVAEGKIKRQKTLTEIGEEERPFELPEGWEWVRLGGLGLTSTGKTPSTSNPQFFGGEIPFIGPGQISVEGSISDPEKWLTETGAGESSLVEAGDILMVCIGGSIGKRAIADRQMAFNQQINSIRVLLADHRYIFCAVSDARFQQSVLDASTGSATPIINRSKWDDLILSLPPLVEQQRIVAQLDQLLTLCDQLKSRLTAARQLHERLAGALVEQAVA